MWNTKTKHKGILSLTGGFIIHTILGTQYMWANQAQYSSSYIYNFNTNPADFVRDETINSIFTFVFFFQGLGIMISSFVEKKIDVRYHCFIGIIFITMTTFVTSFIHSFISYTFFQGLIYGLSVGFIYLIPIRNNFAFYPNKKGFVVGLTMLGFGFGAFLFSLIFESLINPKNIKAIENTSMGQYIYPEAVTDNLQNTLQYLSIIYICLGAIGSLLLVPDNLIKQDKQNKNNDTNETNNETNTNITDQSFQIETPIMNNNQLSDLNTSKIFQFDKEDIRLKDAIQETIFFQLFISLWFSTFFGFIVANYYITFGQEVVYQGYKSPVLINSIAAIGNGLGRLTQANLTDKFKPKQLFLGNMCFQAFLSFTIYPVLNNVEQLYEVYIFIVFFCLGGLMSQMPIILPKLFGSSTGLKVCSLMFGAIFLGCGSSFVAVEWSNKSYLFAFIFSGVLMLVAIFIIYRSDFEVLNIEKINNDQEKYIIQKTVTKDKNGNINVKEKIIASFPSSGSLDNKENVQEKQEVNTKNTETQQMTQIEMINYAEQNQQQKQNQNQNNDKTDIKQNNDSNLNSN